MIPDSISQVDALLFSRGLQPATYTPTLLDVTATVFRVFDAPPISIHTKPDR